MVIAGPPPPPPTGQSVDAGDRDGLTVGGKLLLGALGIGTVAAVTATAVIVIGGRAPDAMDPSAFSVEPDVAWTLEPSDVDAAADSESRFATPAYMKRTYGVPGSFVFGDTIVTTVYQFGDPTKDSTLVALNGGDGSVRWTKPFAPGDSCAPESFDGRLICVEHADRRSTISSYDLETGDEMDSSTVDIYVGHMRVADGSLFVSGVESTSNPASVLMRGTPRDPGAEWTQTYDLHDCPVGGDYDALDVIDGALSWWNLGLVADASTGSERVRGARSDSLGNGVFEVSRCEFPSDEPTRDFYRADGSTVGSWPDSAAVTRETPGTVDDLPVVLSDGTAIGADGERVWYQPAISDRSGTVAVVGGVVVGADVNGHLFGIADDTGDILWRTPAPVAEEGSARHANRVDEERLLVYGETGDLTAISVADGSTDWTVSLAVPDDAIGVVTPGEGMVLAESSTSISAVVPHVDDEKRGRR